MQRKLSNKLSAGSLAILLVAGIIVLSGCKRYSEGERWGLCFDTAIKNTNKFAAKKEKNLDLYKIIGVFNYKNKYLHIYYAGKTDPPDDFVVELDLKTCKARFGDKLETDNPEIVETANKYMVERGRDLSVYETPEIIEDIKEWAIVYREIHPSFDSGLMVIINKKTRETILIGHHGEIPDPQKTGGTLKPSEDSRNRLACRS
ncbi:MAG: hypothetical protein HY796_09655 [Elusimicrobia bacterium]|nr:hypothetical protein [Elusimicrobiota bacterium]